MKPHCCTNLIEGGRTIQKDALIEESVLSEVLQQIGILVNRRKLPKRSNFLQYLTSFYSQKTRSYRQSTSFFVHETFQRFGRHDVQVQAAMKRKIQLMLGQIYFLQDMLPFLLIFASTGWCESRRTVLLASSANTEMTETSKVGLKMLHQHLGNEKYMIL